MSKQELAEAVNLFVKAVGKWVEHESLFNLEQRYAFPPKPPSTRTPDERFLSGRAKKLPSQLARDSLKGNGKAM